MGEKPKKKQMHKQKSEFRLDSFIMRYTNGCDKFYCFSAADGKITKSECNEFNF